MRSFRKSKDNLVESGCRIRYNSDMSRKYTKYNLEIVRKMFADKGRILLAKNYKNPHTPMDYICKCDRQDKITLNNFIRGDECNKCSYEKRSGENNPMWNPDLTEEDRKEREERRYTKNPESIKWRKDIYARDNYTCQCCGDNRGGNLNSHHKNGWNLFKEERYNIENGITFCDICHKEFHNIFNYGNNTLEQVEEFLNPIGAIF